MINVETVLILGAGASAPFGFPTGRELVQNIGKAYEDEKSPEFQFLAELGLKGCTKDDIMDFRDALLFGDPSSVDAWLEHKENEKFRTVGKVAIAINLLQKEKESDFRPINNWYHLLFKALSCSFEEFDKNRLSIITFNYDRSLEADLFLRLGHTYQSRKGNEFFQKLNAIRIVHVYGSLGRLTTQPENPKRPVPEVNYAAKLDRDNIMLASESIKVMVENDESVIGNFNEARKLIEKAQALYFLGFGYDPNNIERLGIEALGKPVKVMGTSYGLGYARIREVERLGLRALRRHHGLICQPVYDFLNDYVDFNELAYPDI